MKIYEIVGEDKIHYGLFLYKEKAELKKLELDNNAKVKGLNYFYNIYELDVIE